MNQWVLIASMHQPRCTFSSIVTPDNSYIYVFGGFDNGPLDSVEKYSVINESWELVQPLQSKRFMHSTFLQIK